MLLILIALVAWQLLLWINLHSFQVAAPLNANEQMNQLVTFQVLEKTNDSVILELANGTNNGLVASQLIGMEFFDGNQWRTIPHRYARHADSEFVINVPLPSHETTISALSFNMFPAFRRIRNSGYRKFRVRVGFSFFNVPHTHFELVAEFSFD